MAAQIKPEYSCGDDCENCDYGGPAGAGPWICPEDDVFGYGPWICPKGSSGWTEVRKLKDGEYAGKLKHTINTSRPDQDPNWTYYYAVCSKKEDKPDEDVEHKGFDAPQTTCPEGNKSITITSKYDGCNNPSGTWSVEKGGTFRNINSSTKGVEKISADSITIDTGEFNNYLDICDEGEWKFRNILDCGSKEIRGVCTVRAETGCCNGAPDPDPGDDPVIELTCPNNPEGMLKVIVKGAEGGTGQWYQEGYDGRPMANPEDINEKRYKSEKQAPGPGEYWYLVDYNGETFKSELCVLEWGEVEKPPPPPGIDIDHNYDGDCVLNSINLFWDGDKYGVWYDQSTIQDIQFINAYDDQKRKIKITFKPYTCIPSCDYINLCSNFTAQGDTIVGWQQGSGRSVNYRGLKLNFGGRILGGSPDGHCTPFKDCKEFVWDCQPTNEKICQPKKVSENVTYEYFVSTHGCNARCADEGGGQDLTYTYVDENGDKLYQGRNGNFKFSVTKNTPVGVYNFKAISECSDHPNNQKLEKAFKITVEDCDPGEAPPKPEPPPPPEPEDGGVECQVDEDQNSITLEFHGSWVDKEGEMHSGNFYPQCIVYECCVDCPDTPPPFEEGDNDDCDNRPDPEEVPNTNTRQKVYLYDRLNHTYVFCCPIKTDVTWLLPFDTIPPVFQRYITTMASVRAAAQMVDNPQLFQLLKDRENTLRMECMNYELEQGDLNYLGQPDYTTYVGYQPIQTLNR